MMSVSDAHYYPILVEQMSYKSQVSDDNDVTFNTMIISLKRCLNYG